MNTATATTRQELDIWAAAEQGTEALRKFVVEHGCCNRDYNLQIFEGWFRRGPRYTFRTVDKKYGLRDKVLCDVGCAFGATLVSCRRGSYGINIEKPEVDFARSLGITVYQRDVVNDALDDLPKVDAVWCAAVLEHAEAQHIFLRKLQRLLKPGGLVGIFVPTVPLFPWMRRLPRISNYFDGHLYPDHVNFYTPATLRLICERAGFETLEVSTFYPGILAPFSRFAPARALVDGCVYVGRSIPNWEYAELCVRRVAENTRGFVFVGDPHSKPPE